MLNRNKSYEVKDWFGDKVAQEVKRNISMCDVFAIMKETEKAVYAMLNLGENFRKCMWVPKSVLIENEVGEQANGTYAHETIFEEDYDKCVKMFKEHWAQFI